MTSMDAEGDAHSAGQRAPLPAGEPPSASAAPPSALPAVGADGLAGIAAPTLAPVGVRSKRARFLEAVAWGALFFGLAGVPCVYPTMILTLMLVNVRLVLFGETPLDPGIEGVEFHLVFSLVVSVVIVAIALGLSWVVAQYRRLSLPTMLVAGYLVGVVPFFALVPLLSA